jgi:elongation factor 2 kinase
MLEIKESKKLAKRSSFLIRRVSEPMIVTDSTMLNLGRLHYQLAVLHGMGRFQEDVAFNNSEDASSHDVFSVLFHLSHAASLRCVPACLSLGRILAGLGTCVSDLLDSLVPIDFEAAKLLLNRALESKNPPNAPKVAAGCVLYQIYSDEAFVARGGIQCGNDSGEKDDQSSTEHSVVSDLVLINLLEKILDLMVSCDEEAKTNLEFKERAKSGSYSFRAGDKVEGNYFLEGNYYPGIVESLTNNGTLIKVKYDDDGTIESLPSEHVRLRIPPTATQTSLGGPLTDEEAGFEGFSDETITIETHKLRSDLAKMVENSGDKLKASKLYETAAHEAMQANKMKLATEWSLKAADILQ